jgi:hypothetical protein
MAHCMSQYDVIPAIVKVRQRNTSSSSSLIIMIKEADQGKRRHPFFLTYQDTVREGGSAFLDQCNQRGWWCRKTLSPSSLIVTIKEEDTEDKDHPTSILCLLSFILRPLSYSSIIASCDWEGPRLRDKINLISWKYSILRFEIWNLTI